MSLNHYQDPDERKPTASKHSHTVFIPPAQLHKTRAIAKEGIVFVWCGKEARSYFEIPDSFAEFKKVALPHFNGMHIIGPCVGMGQSTADRNSEYMNSPEIATGGTAVHEKTTSLVIPAHAQVTYVIPWSVLQSTNKETYPGARTALVALYNANSVLTDSKSKAKLFPVLTLPVEMLSTVPYFVDAVDVLSKDADLIGSLPHLTTDFTLWAHPPLYYPAKMLDTLAEHLSKTPGSKDEIKEKLVTYSKILCTSHLAYSAGFRTVTALDTAVEDTKHFTAGFSVR